MKRIDVVKKDKQWVGQTGKSKTVVSKGRTKETAVRNTAKVAKKDPQPVSVKIHKRDGKIQEERAYPRKADPRGKRGLGSARRPTLFIAQFDKTGSRWRAHKLAQLIW